MTFPQGLSLRSPLGYAGTGQGGAKARTPVLFRAAASSSVAQVATVKIPASVVLGDQLVIVACAARLPSSFGATTIASITFPAGFPSTAVIRRYLTTRYTVRVWTRVAGATDHTKTLHVHGAATCVSAIAVAAYHHVTATYPFAVNAGLGLGSGPQTNSFFINGSGNTGPFRVTWTPPGAIVIKNGLLVSIWCALGNNTGTITPPATSRTHTVTTAWVGIGISDALGTGLAPQTGGIATSNHTRRWAGVSLALTPATP